MQIDIGFSDIITPEPATIVYPAILGHPSPELHAYNHETIAEKFEAMVKLGELNSRMKDFFDIWLLAKTGQFRGAELSQAIEQTFSRRGRALVADPICFTEGFGMNSVKIAQWAAFLRRNTFTDVPDSFSMVIKEAAFEVHLGGWRTMGSPRINPDILTYRSCLEPPITVRLVPLSVRYR